jgi:hypothetical protein
MPVITDTLAFLNHILPHEGRYVGFCLETKTNQFFDSIDRLASWLLESDQAGRTVYHACGAFGQIHKRTQENCVGIRSFFLDLDVGKDKPYATLDAAFQACENFRRSVGLPKPVYVISGRGLHVYWPLDVDLDPATWLRYARALKAACVALHFHADPARTADCASILRSPGTHNYKYDEPILVISGGLEGPYPLEAFKGLLSYVTADTTKFRPDAPRQRKLADELARTFASEPRYGRDIAQACRQLGAMRDVLGRIYEPLRHACFGVLAFCADGEACANEWNQRKSHEDYSPAEIKRKLAQVSKLSGASTCELFHSHDAKTCEACPHWQKILSPISLGKKQEQASPRSAASGAIDRPVLPDSFHWTKYNGLATTVGGKDADREVIISQFPLFLKAVQSGEVRGEHNLAFRLYLPHDGWRDIILSARAVFSGASMAELADKGVIVRDPTQFIRYVRDAVELYHRMSKLMVRYDQFGWKDDNTAFLWGFDLYTATGSTRVVGSEELSVRSSVHGGTCPWVGVAPGGSLFNWKREAEKMFIAGMEPHSFGIMCGFGALLMKFADPVEGGAVVHFISPESGTGKTNTLLVVASIWGQWDGMRLINRESQIAKMLTLAAMGNLPVIHDELVLRDPDMIKEFVHAFSDGRDKTRASNVGQLRHQLAHWQTILMSAANTSLVDVLSTVDKKQAAAWRVIEFQTQLPKDAPYFDNPEFRRAIFANAGHAGQAFLRWLLVPKNLELTKNTVNQIMTQLWKKTGWQSEARFWIRTLACAATAGWIISQLKIIEFNPDRIMSWVLDNMMDPHEVVPSDWSVSAVGEFLMENVECAMTFARPWSYGVEQMPLRELRGKLWIRYETESHRVFILQSALRNWLIKKQLSYTALVNDLNKQGAVINKKRRVTLSAGYKPIPAVQVWCLELNTNHPALSGFLPDEVRDNVVPFKPAGDDDPPPESAGLSPGADQTPPGA